MSLPGAETNLIRLPTASPTASSDTPMLPTRPGWLARRMRRLRTIWHRWRQPSRVRLHGVAIRIDRDVFSEKIIRRLYDGGYEQDECAALAQTLAADDRVLELGSGVGYIASFAARKIGGDRVTTCEANPALIPVIEQTFRDNRVQPQLLNGVMARDRRAGQSQAFYVHKRNFWSSSLTDLGADFRRVSVPCMHWPTLLARIRPSYLVMDIEGGEIDLLHDFDAAFVTKLLVEFHPKKSSQHGIDRVFEHLAGQGFSRQRVTSGSHIYFFRRQNRLEPSTLS